MNNGGLPVHSCTRGSASSVLVITVLRSHRATHPTCRTKRICAAFCAGSSSIWSFSPERSAAARRRHLRSRRSPKGGDRSETLSTPGNIVFRRGGGGRKLAV